MTDEKLEKAKKLSRELAMYALQFERRLIEDETIHLIALSNIETTLHSLNKLVFNHSEPKP